MSPDEMARIHRAAMAMPRPWSVAEFRSLVAYPDTIVVDACQGFALGRVVLDEAELLTIAVDPAAQRQGIGRACLDAFHEIARDRGAVTAFLEVAESNAAGRALYAAAGYGAAGRRRDYYAGTPAVDALVLRLVLADLG